MSWIERKLEGGLKRWDKYLKPFDRGFDNMSPTARFIYLLIIPYSVAIVGVHDFMHDPEHPWVFTKELDDFVKTTVRGATSAAVKGFNDLVDTKPPEPVPTDAQIEAQGGKTLNQLTSEAYDHRVDQEVAKGSHPVWDAGDIEHPKFRDRLAEWLGSGLSDAERAKIVNAIIEAGGYTDKSGASFQLWETKDGYFNAIRLPVDDAPHLPKFDGHKWHLEGPAPQPTTTAQPTQVPVETTQPKPEDVQKVPSPKPELKPKPPVLPAEVPVEQHKPHIHRSTQEERDLARLAMRDGVPPQEGAPNGFAHLTAGTEPTVQDIDTLQDFLARKGLVVTDEQAAQIYKDGYYTVNGVRYELWRSNLRDSVGVLETPKKGPIKLEVFFSTEADPPKPTHNK